MTRVLFVLTAVVQLYNTWRMQVMRNTYSFSRKQSVALLLLLASVFSFVGCSTNEERSDAYGNFEATEVVISAEASGTLLHFSVQEGATLDSGVVVGLVDTMQLSLKRAQLVAQRAAVATKASNVLAQIAVIDEQQRVVQRELDRVERLLEQNAATQKQYDDISGKISVFTKQKEAIETQNSSVLGELRVIDTQIAQMDDQLHRAAIVNPIAGTVLMTYADEREMAIMGKPLYSIADMRELVLRAYISGDQLPHVKLGDTVHVLIDSTKTANQNLHGVVSWISSKAEFTPRIIQTKEERVNMVYAIKVRVQNDGRLKIGMPGEVRFQ